MKTFKFNQKVSVISCPTQLEINQDQVTEIMDELNQSLADPCYELSKLKSKLLKLPPESKQTVSNQIIWFVRSFSDTRVEKFVKEVLN
jgi:hypothetical protein